MKSFIRIHAVSLILLSCWAHTAQAAEGAGLVAAQAAAGAGAAEQPEGAQFMLFKLIKQEGGSSMMTQRRADAYADALAKQAVAIRAQASYQVRTAGVCVACNESYVTRSHILAWQHCKRKDDVHVIHRACHDLVLRKHAGGFWLTTEKCLGCNPAELEQFKEWTVSAADQQRQEREERRAQANEEARQEAARKRADEEQVARREALKCIIQ